jgi:hypothetical protein
MALRCCACGNCLRSAASARRPADRTAQVASALPRPTALASASLEHARSCIEFASRRCQQAHARCSVRGPSGPAITRPSGSSTSPVHASRTAPPAAHATLAQQHRRVQRLHHVGVAQRASIWSRFSANAPQPPPHRALTKLERQPRHNARWLSTRDAAGKPPCRVPPWSSGRNVTRPRARASHAPPPQAAASVIDGTSKACKTRSPSAASTTASCITDSLGNRSSPPAGPPRPQSASPRSRASSTDRTNAPGDSPTRASPSRAASPDAHSSPREVLFKFSATRLAASRPLAQSLASSPSRRRQSVSVSCTRARASASRSPPPAAAAAGSACSLASMPPLRPSRFAPARRSLLLVRIATAGAPSASDRRDARPRALAIDLCDRPPPAPRLCRSCTLGVMLRAILRPGPGIAAFHQRRAQHSAEPLRRAALVSAQRRRQSVSAKRDSGLRSPSHPGLIGLDPAPGVVEGPLRHLAPLASPWPLRARDGCVPRIRARCARQRLGPSDLCALAAPTPRTASARVAASPRRSPGAARPGREPFNAAGASSS